MLLKERSDIMKKRKSKHSEDDEIPKALRNMKKNNKDKNSENIKKTKNKKNKFKKVIISLIIIVILILGISLGISANTWKKLSVEMVKNESSTVVDKDGQTIAKLGDERKKKNVTSEEIPKNLKNAYISIEDERFYEHKGVDIISLTRSLLHNILSDTTQGGSTIEMQISKNLLTSDDRNMKRKIKDIYYATQMDKFMTKDEILCTYLNNVYFGKSAYGVGKASKVYFGKNVQDLTLAQSAMLVGITNNPAKYKEHREAKKRQEVILYKMKELGYIDEEEYSQAISEKVPFKSEIE